MLRFVLKEAAKLLIMILALGALWIATPGDKEEHGTRAAHIHKEAKQAGLSAGLQRAGQARAR